MKHEDEGLRVLAIARLGPHAPALAREALESGVVEVESDVLAWEGSLGNVHAHRVILGVAPELQARIEAVPSAVDALTAAIAAAVGGVSGNALAELRIEPRATLPMRATPYRGRL